MKKLATTATLWLGVLAILVGLPILIFVLQARHSGLPVSEQWQQFTRRWQRTEEDSGTASPAATRTGEPIDFLRAQAIGVAATDAPRIAFVRVTDLDRNGTDDVLVCDAIAHRIGWIHADADGTLNETVFPNETAAPAHVEPCDVDRDGDLDLLVASMGMLFPNNDRVGAVLILENDGHQTFTSHIAAERIARVTDVRGGDLDGDGDVDLVAGQFGYDDGEVRWLENQGDWRFESHVLLHLSGTIHTPLADIDGDGDLDIIALVTQEWEETYLFENDGKGQFQTRLIYGSTNEDYGSSGISLMDLDGDGDLDVLYTNGDAFDYIPPRPRPWHGLQWLENQGDDGFAFHRIGDFPGASVARAADLDRDGDPDIVVCSAYNQWEKPGALSLGWYENQGDLTFIFRPVASAPTHLIALDVGDLNGDGWIDIVTGGMHVYPPYDRVGRVTWWRNRWNNDKREPNGRQPKQNAPGSRGSDGP
ncbi:MAG: VCBS repeat-containing protein [Lentisphaerae bacterium]|nr:VCBS repeat-containing protein [Lentisphaerota bacterium]MBT5606742.1 VCBS repeat-containing protein [Lentisphaerota bacterium]MBT7055860.1 VCBS repeat-containing protein [Lentisphaerota bacterium]MBT7847476.1 VCBS repeat-containing protein [Lentisphaerota bacterium]